MSPIIFDENPPPSPPPESVVPRARIVTTKRATTNGTSIQLVRSRSSRFSRRRSVLSRRRVRKVHACPCHAMPCHPRHDSFESCISRTHASSRVTRRRSRHRREIRNTRLSIARGFFRRRSIRPTTIATTTKKRRTTTTTMGVDDRHPHAEVLRVKKISEHATIPSRGSDGAAGYDLSRYAMDAWRSSSIGGTDRWSVDA